MVSLSATTSKNNPPLYDTTRMDNLTSSQIGKIGEYLTASVLGGYGLEVYMTDGKGFDILVMGDEAIRVDVKTTRSLSRSGGFHIKKGKTTAFRDFDPQDCDVFALVCLEDSSLSFHRAEDHAGKRKIYLNADTHRATDPYESWVTTVAALRAKSSG